MRPVESSNPRIAGALAAFAATWPDGEIEVTPIIEVSAHVLRATPDAARDALHDLAHETLENVAPAPRENDISACHAVGYALQVGLLIGYHLAAGDALAADVVDLGPRP